MAKASSISDDYILNRVPIAEEKQKLETQAVYVGTITAQQASKVLHFISKRLPKLEGIEHVKRVKRIDPPSQEQKSGSPDKAYPPLLVVLCQCHKITRPQLDALLATDTEWGTNMQVDVHQVPSNPPYTRAQFDEWKTLWPVAYRPLVQLKPVCIGEKERAYICRNLASVAQMHKEPQQQNTTTIPAAVVIANPETQIVVAQSIDRTTVDRHPLRHAVMCCITNASESEVQKSVSRDEDRSKMTDNADNEYASLVPAKRHAPSGEDMPDPAGGYLCEELDVFASREPCTMCCMALVHSRIGRLFFIEPRKGGGISYHSMHSLKALNHHFTAFQCTQADKQQLSTE
ncbi:tRNA-specific adenosine deaminase subunit tad3 [Coemansia sp. RSA 1813]|nr:tRNA-specific adenosine deaminase subunit tad3 [Coemansia sp. RSA 1646]KAJ1769568.1 tRNA-specific adenosine deaminase subunit tad3 [Coemansia sp. RSA 1843]KAJ2216987.1 tRNA-specific adenosine deaminase subunit tad3 [Coemansia sp. RSA 487]KAJ2568073.1 tRNA-specific adenosine deaminase subunit tad3 [Coemansia sp. RSA 1813]